MIAELKKVTQKTLSLIKSDSSERLEKKAKEAR